MILRVGRRITQVVADGDRQRVEVDSPMRLPMQVTGQNVLVTGGSAGIGLALARAFRGRGNQVMICGRSVDRLAQAAQEVPGLETVQCDIADDSDLRRLVETVATRWGGLSLLVNNAGVQLTYDFTKVDVASVIGDIELEIRTNLGALIKLSALCLPLLRQQAAGAIVNVSSVLGLVPRRNAAVYCATKAAVHFFSRALREQMQRSAPSVEVFEVLPLLVDTRMVRGRRSSRKLSPERAAELVIRGVAGNRYEIGLGRMGLLIWINRLQFWLGDLILRTA